MAETRIDYPKHWFVVLTVIIEALIAYLFLAALLDPNSIWREFWLVLCPLVGGVTFVFLAPPVFTHHSIDSNGLRLRMGLLIDAMIPLSSIESAKQTATTRGGLRIGIGARFFPIKGQLFVTSGFSNMVSLRLASPLSIGKLRKHKVEEVILNVSFPKGLMDALEKAGAGSGRG